MEHFKNVANFGDRRFQQECVDSALDLAVQMRKLMKDKPLTIEWIGCFLSRWPEMRILKPTVLELALQTIHSSEFRSLSPSNDLQEREDHHYLGMWQCQLYGYSTFSRTANGTRIFTWCIGQRFWMRQGGQCIQTTRSLCPFLLVGSCMRIGSAKLNYRPRLASTYQLFTTTYGFSLLYPLWVGVHFQGTQTSEGVTCNSYEV